jgi:hypothetical protein
MFSALACFWTIYVDLCALFKERLQYTALSFAKCQHFRALCECARCTLAQRRVPLDCLMCLVGFGLIGYDLGMLAFHVA